MWAGKYVRSPLARNLFLNMVTENEVPGHETQKVSETFSIRVLDTDAVWLLENISCPCLNYKTDL